MDDGTFSVGCHGRCYCLKLKVGNTNAKVGAGVVGGGSCLNLKELGTVTLSNALTLTVRVNGWSGGLELKALADGCVGAGAIGLWRGGDDLVLIIVALGKVSANAILDRGGRNQDVLRGGVVTDGEVATNTIGDASGCHHLVLLRGARGEG